MLSIKNMTSFIRERVLMHEPKDHGNNLVFVYGTLQKGEPNHYLLDREPLEEEAMTEEKYYLYSNGHFPKVSKVATHINDKSYNILGELYSVGPTTMRLLDQLERHPDWYEREEVGVYCTLLGKKVTAWMYFCPFINDSDKFQSKAMGLWQSG